MNEKEALSEIEKAKRKIIASTKASLIKVFTLYSGRWMLNICPTCKDQDNCTIFDKITETTDTFIRLTFKAFMEQLSDEDTSDFLKSIEESLSNTVEDWKTKGDFK